jgi:Large polyvalent protein associated domain 38
VLQINKIKALAKGDETQTKNLKNKLNDAIHDSQGPAKRWLQALPISANARERIINVLYLAPGKRDTILNNAMEKHGGDAMIKALAAIKKGAKGLTHETVTMWVGHWITANHVAEKNAMLVARRAQAHSDAAQAAALKPNDFRLKLKEAEALQAYTDQVKAVSSTNLDAGSENGPPHAMGVAGGMNNAQAAATMQAVEEKFDVAQLKAVADAVYDMNAFRLALDIENGKTQVSTVAKFLSITAEEQARLQELQDARAVGTVTEAMRDAARAIVRSEYVPMTGHPLSAIDDPTEGLFSTGAAQPNTGKDYVMEGRTRGIADNGIATSMKGLIRSATFAGYADFTSGIGEVFDMLTPEQRTAVGLSKENINGLTRGSDNVLLDGRTNNTVGYSIQDANVLDAIRAGNVDEQDGLLRKFAMPTTRMFAYLVTQANPLFGPKNLINDMIERSLIASTREYHTETGAKVTIGATDVIANSPAAMAAVNRLIRGKADYTNDADVALRDFIEDGGLSTSREAFARDAKALAQRVRGIGTGADPRVAVRAVGDWIEKYNKQFDMVAPLSSYLALRSAGVSKVDAAGGALDLMNYRKKGAKTSGFITPLYAFAQPAFTGGANLLKMLGTTKGQRIAVTSLVAFLALQALSEAGADEDEGGNLIRQLPNYARNNNINVQIGNNVASIPVGFGVTKLANTAARAILDYGNKGNSIPKSIYDVMSEGFMTSLTPFEDNDIKDPVKNLLYGTTPTVLKGAAGYALNTRADGAEIDRADWLDRDKYKHRQGSKKIAPEYRSMAEMLYNATGWDMTPDAMKYLVQSYGIGPFKHVVANTITNPQKKIEGKDTGIPLAGSFIAPVFKPLNDDAWRGQMRKIREDMDDMRKETEKLELDKASEARVAFRELQTSPEYRLMGEFDKVDKELLAEAAAVTRSVNKKQITASEEERRRESIRDRRKDFEAKFLKKWRKMKGLE